MNRNVIAGMVGLTLAGCAQGRSALPQGARPVPPVALTSDLPSIHETIGQGNPPHDAATLRAVHASNGWKTPAGSSPTQVAVEGRPATVTDQAAGSPRPQAPAAESTSAPAESAIAAAPPAGPAPNAEGASTRVAITPTNAPDPSVGPVPDAVPGMAQSSSPAPTDAGRIPPPDPLLGANPNLMPAVDALPSPAAPQAGPAITASVPDPSVGPMPDAVPDPAPSPKADASAIPAASETPPSDDPLLGAHPNLGPPADPAGPSLPAASGGTPAPQPAGEGAGPDPAAGLPPLPGPGPVGASPAVPAGPAAAPGPGPAPAELPPLPPPGAEAPLPPLPPPGPQAPPPGAEAAAPDPTRDAEVKPVASDPTMIRSDVKPKPLKAAGRTFARVGDEIITRYQLDSALAEELRRTNPGRRLGKDELDYLAGIILNKLIERSMIVQEAKRELKDAKKIQSIMEIADKSWRAEELPPLLRQTASANEHELRQKLADQGRSLDEMRENYRLDFLAQGYLQQKLNHRMKVELPQMRNYYNAHLQDFVHPAQVTWREISVSVEKLPGRAEARRKAEMLRERLQRGQDFAALAQAESDGPTKSKGGLWPEMSLGSYAVPAVNEALESLPLRQLSPVIEGPSSFHIVRVEDRRPAGPSTFAEVQDKIKQALLQEVRKKESTEFLEKVRGRTAITTIFDGTASDPALARAATGP